MSIVAASDALAPAAPSEDSDAEQSAPSIVSRVNAEGASMEISSADEGEQSAANLFASYTASDIHS